MADSFASLRDFSVSEHTSFVATVDGLAADQWTAESACPGWRVADLVAHVTGGVAGIAELIERGLADSDGPPPWFDSAKSIPENMRPRHARLAAMSSSELRAELHRAVDAYAAVLAPLDDAAAAKVCWFYRGPTPVTGLVGIRTGDTLVHRADIRRAVGLGDWFSDAGARYMGGSTLARLGMFYKPERAGGAAGTVRLELSGEPKDVTFGASGIEVGEAPAHTAMLRTDHGTLILLVWHRMPLAEAESAGLAAVRGDRKLVETLLHAVVTP
jgi:uncharacterized protein (TIGR03083 family)